MFKSKPNIILSILIPTRNRANYLNFAIQSALNINSNDIEIIVSENFSQDNSLEICNSFSDPRLTILQPPNPLPMHENWEFLLKYSQGRWVTFIGDDDAIMPHCLDHLKWLDKEFPQAEAIVSSRAYYFWNGCQEQYGEVVTQFTFANKQIWQDSKTKMNDTLEGKINYIQLPQMYSGGFHRRSLINRVIACQNGKYFKSVTPDAYSALMACIHTYRYLETLVPMTWVGSSPHKALISSEKSVTKDRESDFWGLFKQDSLTMHQTLGDLKQATFLLYFYEAYISAFPLTSPELLSRKKVESVFIESVKQLRQSGREDVVIKLAYDLGFSIPVKDEDKNLWFLIQHINSLKNLLSRIKNKIISIINQKTMKEVALSYNSTSHQKHPDILSCDTILNEFYCKCVDS